MYKSNATDSKLHYYWLDLLRFLAAFLVMCGHYRGAFFVEYGLLPDNQKNIFNGFMFFVTRVGYESVLVFFVMSGFLVGGKALERILNNTVDVKSYTIDRSVRILLPLIASILLTIIVYLIIGEKLPVFNMLGSLFSLQGIVTNVSFNEPLWSLSYEVWFYILMGCLMCICRVKNKTFITISFLLLLICFAVFTKLKPIYLFIWLLGAVSKLFASKRTYTKKHVGLFFVLLICFLVLLQITQESKSIILKIGLLFNRDILILLFAFTVCLFISSIVQMKPRHKIGLKLNMVGSRLAVFSYTLYLTHVPVLRLLQHLGFPISTKIDICSISLYLCSLVIGLSVSYIMYLLFEKQTDRVKHFCKVNLVWQKER